MMLMVRSMTMKDDEIIPRGSQEKSNKRCLSKYILQISWKLNVNNLLSYCNCTKCKFVENSKQLSYCTIQHTQSLCFLCNKINITKFKSFYSFFIWSLTLFVEKWDYLEYSCLSSRFKLCFDNFEQTFERGPKKTYTRPP